MNKERQIMFFDYSALNNWLEKDIQYNISKLISFKTTKDYDLLVTKFEESFAKYCECNYCIALNSGTSALQLAMYSMGIGKGDEVILPAYTFAASAIAISNIGAKPVFVDILPTDLTIDPNQIENKITDKTKAIMAVHIHGNPCDLDPIAEICKKHNLFLIEDASQAHGALYNKKKIGSFGIGCFSLHMSKNIGGIGNAGAITLHDITQRNKIKKCINPDNNSKKVLGSNRTPCEMDAIHACFLLPKLNVLDKINKRKREMAELYHDNIKNPICTKPLLNNKGSGVYRDYYVMIKEREKIIKILLSKGIETKARYKIPLHLTNTYKYLGYKKGDFPIAERAAKEVLCLPTHMNISNEDIQYICKIINNIKIV